MPTTQVIPVLRYRDLEEALSWLCDAFGFDTHRVVRAVDGDIAYAQLTFAGSMIMLGRIGDAGIDALMKQPDEVGGAETQISYFVVADADAHYKRAKAAGAQIALDLADYDHGGRGYSCHDPEGHAWSFGSYDPWALDPSATSLPRLVGSRRWRTHVLVAAALTMALAGAVAGGWMLVASQGSDTAAASYASGVQLGLRSQPPDETAARLTADSERLSQAQEREAEARRVSGEAEQKAARLDEMLKATLVAKDAATQAAAALDQDLQNIIAAKRTAEQKTTRLDEMLKAALVAKDAATQAAAALDQDLQSIKAAKLIADQRISQLTSALEREQEAAASNGRAARDVRQELESERHARENAERVHERHRQQLLDELADAERARRTATDALEEMIRNQAATSMTKPTLPELSVRPAVTHAAPVTDGPGKQNRRAKPLPEQAASEADKMRRANLRRRCAEIKSNPDGYETDLVEFCRTL